MEDLSFRTRAGFCLVKESDEFLQVKALDKRSVVCVRICAQRGTGRNADGL